MLDTHISLLRTSHAENLSEGDAEKCSWLCSLGEEVNGNLGEE